MAFITGEDEFGEIPLTIFPTTYKRFNNIEEGNIVKVFGRVERRFDKYQVIVNNIQIIEQEDNVMKGKFIVISGPGGVGKDTIAKELVNKGIAIYSVSMTTRKKRSNEIDGKDYFFVDINTFENNIKDGKILEYTLFNGNYYGTPSEFIFNNLEKGTNVIGVLDIKGVLNVEKIYPEAISIFIMPPSFEELEKRIRNRNTDSEEVIKERLEIAKDEIKCKDKYDYVVINNTVDKAVEEIIQIIKNEKNICN